jgi:hypothetical protein
VPPAGTGRIDLRGELRGIAEGRPAAAQAHLVLVDMPLDVLDRYLDSYVDLDVQKAQGAFTGDLSWEARGTATSVRVHGDATIDDFRAVRTGDATATATPPGAVRGVSSTRPLLNWKTLSLRGVDVALEPDAPLRVAIAETALSDFYARVVLDESGHLNLADITHPAGETPAPADGAASAPPAPPAPSAAASRPAPNAAPATSNASSPVFDIGPIAVANGRIDYNDRFVKPSYSAALSELNGRLGAFSSRAPAGGTPQLAPLELRGRAQGTATLEITGQVNPLAKPLALDVKAQVRDLELPPLSPYAIKYAGYGIERGKLSADLAYVVKPDGQLSATNKVVLNQLAFGEKDPAATSSLPVKLAVALLADSHGVIDVDLPVSGSINDPQFSIGGVVMKAIGNLVLKAVTAPFTLLASAFHGSGGASGEDLSSVSFAPGTSTLAAAEKERLDKLAKAMLERPAVNLTVVGEARLDAEKDAWKRERLAQMVRAEKRRQSIAGGAAPNAEVVVTDAEYAALLKQVYARAELDTKPKNVLGIAKDIPTTEMETLLLASISVGEETMSQLAVRRAVVVRDYLATQQVPTSRLFLGAPKATASADDTAWKPRADLKLAAD